MWEARLTAHFAVNLFVTAIADGALAHDTPPKVVDRLRQIVRKVPKEQNTSVEVGVACKPLSPAPVLSAEAIIGCQPPRAVCVSHQPAR